jgi:DHA3 family tetracycline resistance protein-like MFS transporter
LNKLSASFIFLFEGFVSGFAMKLAYTTYIIYRVDVLGLDPLQLVLAGTVLESTVFIFEIPTGVVADLYSRRLSSIVGFFILGFGILIEGLFPLFSVLIISQVIASIGWTFISGAHSAWITDEVDSDKVGDLFLRTSQLDKLGALIAIPVAVVLANINLAIPFLVGGGTMMLMALFMAAFMPEEGFKTASKKERESWQDFWKPVQEGISILRGRQILVIFSLIALLIGIYSEAWDRLAQPLLLENFKFPDLAGFEMDAIAWFAVLNTAILVLGLLGNAIARRFVDTSKSVQLLKALQTIFIGMVAAILIFALSGKLFIAIAALLIFDVLRALSFPLANAWINQQIDSKLRATLLSMTGQLDALGQLGGGPILGWIGRTRSLRTALLASAFVLAPVTLLYGRIRKLTSRK